MSKHMTERAIGLRAATCVRERVGKRGDLTKEMVCLGTDRKTIYYWDTGHPPSVFVLQAMALRGYDVHYILTGFRKVPKNSAIDSPLDKP